MPNRLSIVTREALPEDQRRFHDAVAAIRRRSITGPFITLLNSSPDLAARFAHLGHYYHARGQADESILPARVRTLIALIGSRALDGPYEWAAWVGWALDAGIPQDTADAIRERRTPRDLTPEDALVLDFCNQLLSGTHRVSDATYKAALEHFGAQGVVELTGTLGYFAMIAFPLNAFEIEMSAEQKGMRKAFVPLPVEAAVYQTSDGSRRVTELGSDERPAQGGEARIAPIRTHADLAPVHQHFFDRIILTRGRVGGPFQVLLHSPDVAARVAHIGDYLLYGTVLAPRAKTLTWLIAAREFDCDYEWRFSAAAAHKAGVAQSLIDAIRKGETPKDASREQRLQMDFCHQLLRGNHHVGEPTYRATIEHFGVAATVQIAATLGYFAMQAMTLNAFEVAASGDGEDLSL